MGVALRVLGPVEVVNGEDVVALPGRKHRRLLAALAIENGRTCSVDALADAVWGSSPPATARKLLQVYVSQLRKALPDEIAVVTRPAGYALDLSRASFDAANFERLLTEASGLLATGNPVLAASLTEQALALWRGSAFADVMDDEVARGEAARLEELRLVGIETRLDAKLQLGMHDEVLGELVALADGHPLRERVQALAMTALYRAGRQVDALTRYSSHRAMLDSELGLEPGHELRSLERRILQHDPALDLAREQAETVSLPEPPNRLVGRERELAALAALLATRAARLLVLTGAGGSGKTRLALEAARRAAASYANGAALVELAALRSSELVVPTIAHALGVAEAEQPLDALAAALRPRELLLVVDNAEHVRAAAPALVELLTRAPYLTIIVTSRAVLHVSGEHVFPVSPLEDEAARQLFEQRAAARQPDFRMTVENEDSVSEICRRVDCLPLALELAAARVRTLTLRKLLERLDDRLDVLTTGLRDLPARQQTLRETIAWSVDLLDERARQVFARLAVFQGGATYDAAEVVGGADLDTLDALVDDHLVRRDDAQGEARFAMLETIRDYALELLGDERAAVERAMVDWLADTVDETDFRGSDLDVVLTRFDAELDNVRAALDVARRQGADESALRIAGGLLRFWFSRGLAAEGRAHIEGALERAGPRPTPARARARALHAGGGLAYTQGDYARAKELAAEAVAVAGHVGSLEDEAWAHNVLGIVARAEGDFASARGHLVRAATLQEQLGIEPIVARLNLASATLNEGDAAAAVPLFESVLEYFLRLGELGEGQGLAHHNLGQARYRLADYERARTHFEEAHRSFVTIGFRAHAGHALQGAAAAEAACGRHERAAELLGCASAQLDDIAWSPEDLDPTLASEAEAAARLALGDAAYDEAHARGRLPNHARTTI